VKGGEGKEEKSNMSKAEKSEAEEGKEEKSNVTEEEKRMKEGGQKDKEKPGAKLMKARRGKCKIQSEDKGKEEEKTEAVVHEKKQPHVTINLLQEEIKLVPHTPPSVHKYSKGDMEDQCHCTPSYLLSQMLS
jgi:hypothetical protein